MPMEPRVSFTVGDRRVAAIGLLLTVLGVAIGGYRVVTEYHTPGPFTFNDSGFCDFHNGLYFPSRAVIDGVSPYGEGYAQSYPVSRQIPFFSPSFLVLHSPFASLPLRLSEYLYFVFNVIVALGIGALTASLVGRPKRLDVILAVTAAVVFSRGGHTTIQDGYFTFEIVLAAILAVHWASSKPWFSGVALLVVSAKPTYVIPLGFLMLARGNIKALVIGAVLSLVGAALPFGWISYNRGNGDLVAGFTEIIHDIQGSQDKHLGVPSESPINTWTRLDLLAVIAKWQRKDPGTTAHLAMMMVVLVVPMLVLLRRCRQGIDDGAAGITGMVIFTAFLVSLYHHSYDALVLVAPISGVLFARPESWLAHRKALRWMLAALMLVPLYNYLSTRMILMRLDPSLAAQDVATSINGVTLTVLLLLSCYLAFRDAPTADEITPDNRVG